MYTTVSKINSLITTTLPVADYIEMVSRRIDSILGYRLGYIAGVDTPKDLYFDGSGTNSLILGMFILPDFGDVENDGATVSVIKYPLNKDYVSYLKGGFTKGDANTVIKNAKIGRYTVDFGNVGHNLPSDIEQACITLTVASLQKDMGNVSSGVKSSETIGAYSVSYDNSVENSKDMQVIRAMNILDNYKLILFY